jgi:dihydroxy-acid dehydratase
MNSIAEALGMTLPGCAAIPAPYGERAQIACDTGVRVVHMVRENVTPRSIMTRQAFETSAPASTLHPRAAASYEGLNLA